MTEPQSPPSASDPDLDQLEAFRRGDASAFDHLVRRHQDRIVRLSRRILGDQEAALDAAQETFVKAWRALSRFQGESKFSTWLTRIAINQCRNELRKRGTVKHTQPSSLDAALPGTELKRRDVVEGQEPEAWAEAEADEMRRALDTALLDLEPEAREVLVLREVEALSYEGMAEILDVAVGTVRSRLHRARAALRERVLRSLGAAS